MNKDIDTEMSWHRLYRHFRAWPVGLVELIEPRVDGDDLNSVALGQCGGKNR